MMKTPKPNPASSDDKDVLFGDYDEYAKILRTWFVAYRIGGPLLLVSNHAIRTRITTSGWCRWIALAFLTGVGFQVLLTIANKTALWGCYRAARQPRLIERPIYRAAQWFAYTLWVDLLIDVLSLLAFSWATYKGFEVLTS